MTRNGNLRMHSRIVSTFHRLLCGGLGFLIPWSAQAASETANSGATTGTSSLTGVGRALGMMLFAYLALKWTNRRKSDDDDETGFMGQHIKPIYVWLVIIAGVVLLMWRSG